MAGCDALYCSVICGLEVIKMLFIVVALFAICWLPLQSYNVLQAVFPSINEYRYINIIWFCCDWLAMSNSCCNPIIYGIYSDKFKREFARRFRLASTASTQSQTYGGSFRREDGVNNRTQRTFEAVLTIEDSTEDSLRKASTMSRSP